MLGGLDTWWSESVAPRLPDAWDQPLRALGQEVLAAADDGDRALIVAPDSVLSRCVGSSSSTSDPVAQRWSAPDATSASTFSRTGTTNFGKDPDEDRDD